MRLMDLTSEVLDVSTIHDGSQLGAGRVRAKQGLDGDGRHGGLLVYREECELKLQWLETKRAAA